MATTQKLTDAILEVKRQYEAMVLNYPKWVSDGKILQEDANSRIIAMENAHTYLYSMFNYLKQIVDYETATKEHDGASQNS